MGCSVFTKSYPLPSLRESFALEMPPLLNLFKGGGISSWVSYLLVLVSEVDTTVDCAECFLKVFKGLLGFIVDSACFFC